MLQPTIQEHESKDLFQQGLIALSSNRQECEKYILHILRQRTDGFISSTQLINHLSFWGLFYKTTTDKALASLTKQNLITRSRGNVKLIKE